MRWIWTDSKPVFPHRNSLDGIVGEETKIHGSGVRENREYEHGCLGLGPRFARNLALGMWMHSLNI